jgi:glycosyltransferase involved in cell wall biosynthesis
MNATSLRVLHVMGELRPSGAETMLRAAAGEFLKHGIYCEILSTGAEVGPFASRLADAGWRIHHIPFSKTPTFFASVFRLMNGRYDAIHLHTERGNFWLALAALLAVRGRVIRTVHGSFAFVGFLRWRRMIQRRLLEWMGVRHVAISESVRQVEEKCFRTTPLVIHNWYNSSHFRLPTEADRSSARRLMDITAEVLVLVSVGNCAEVKNHLAVLEALATLPAEQRPMYVHVGQEDEGESERRRAAQLGISEYVRFVGPLSDVRPALYAADAFIMPSLREGFGVAAIEALGCGLPVILSDVQGLRDFRRVFPNLVYCGTSPAQIAQCLADMLNAQCLSPTTLSEVRAALSREHFGVELGVSQYAKLYRRAFLS